MDRIENNFVKADCAQELTKAVEFLGWISESGIANDLLHNAKLESTIRRIKEGVRAIHSKSGLPDEMWSHSIKHFTTAFSFTNKAPVHPTDTEETKTFKEGKTCYEVANKGDPFKGIVFPWELWFSVSHLSTENFQLSIQELCHEYFADGV